MRQRTAVARTADSALSLDRGLSGQKLRLLPNSDRLVIVGADSPSAPGRIGTPGCRRPREAAATELAKPSTARSTTAAACPGLFSGRRAYPGQRARCPPAGNQRRDGAERPRNLRPRLGIGRGENSYSRFMSTSDLSSQEIRAAAEAHRELGPEYHDAVMESFLAKVEKEIDARVDARLAASGSPRRRQLDAATLAKRRRALKHKALGSVAAAIPLSIVSLFAHGLTGGAAAVGSWTGTIVFLAAVWILIAAVYGVCALRLMPPRSERDHS